MLAKLLEGDYSDTERLKIIKNHLPKELKPFFLDENRYPIPLVTFKNKNIGLTGSVCLNIRYSDHGPKHLKCYFDINMYQELDRQGNNSFTTFKSLSTHSYDLDNIERMAEDVRAFKKVFDKVNDNSDVDAYLALYEVGQHNCRLALECLKDYFRKNNIPFKTFYEGVEFEMNGEKRKAVICGSFNGLKPSVRVYKANDEDYKLMSSYAPFEDLTRLL